MDATSSSESDPGIEELYKAMFPYRSMSPEEFAARRSHGIACFGLHRRTYGDPEFGQWVRRLGAILGDADETDRCRRNYLALDEYAAVQLALQDVAEHGY